MIKAICKMFHVEHFCKLKIDFRLISLFLVFQGLAGCGVTKQRIEIQDFLISVNGIAIEKSKPLNAFVFENDLNNQPFQNFLTSFYKTNSLYNTKIEFVLDNAKFKLIVYDNDDFEKYFGRNNFIEKNLENTSILSGNNSKFIALSVISSSNEDCLNPKSLFYNNTVEYLKNLKKQYLSKNDR